MENYITIYLYTSAVFALGYFWKDIKNKIKGK